MSDLQFAQSHRNRNWTPSLAWVYAQHKIHPTGYLIFFESIKVCTTLLHIAHCLAKTVGFVRGLDQRC